MTTPTLTAAADIDTDTATATATGTLKALTVGTAAVRYRTHGSGPGLVLVHGTGRGSATWDALVPRFADRHTVILPDLSGSDAVTDDGTPLTIDLLVGQLAAVIEDTGLGPVDVLGHSLGATVALALAGTRPDLVHRLIPLAGISHAGDPYFHSAMEQFLALADRPAEFARFAMLTAYSHRHLSSVSPETLAELSRGFVPTPARIRQFELDLRMDVRDRLPLISAPTLVIGCTDDNLVPVANSRAIHAAVRGSRYAELASGHVARVERPDELVDLVRGFFEV